MLKFILPLALLAVTACVPVGPGSYDPVTNPGGELRPGDCFTDADGTVVCT